MDVRITFDERDMTTTFTDTVETGEVRVVVTYPDEIVRDLGKSLKASTDWMLSIPARTDLLGNIMQGTYTVLVERYNVGGTTPTGSETASFDLAYDKLPVTVTESWDVFTPSFRLTDATSYTRPNFISVAPLSRLWTARNGTHEWSQASSSFLTLYDGGYFAGEYEWSLRVAITSAMNDFVVIISEEVVTGTKTIKSPIMLEEIYALMGCLFGKMKAKECCKDASYERMKSDYIYASSLLFNFVLGGQAGNTAQLADMLNGTDCQDGILTILKRWGCYDETIASTAISAYDFCLCSDSGTGGGGSFQQEGYDAGNGCWLVSDATDDDDRWTFSKSSGVGTFTQNLAGSKIFGGTIRGTAGDATYNANGATMSFKLVIPVPGESANVDYASLLMANMDVFSSHPANPTPSSPYVKQYGSVEIRLESISSGLLSFSFVNIGETLSGGWTIVFKLLY